MALGCTVAELLERMDSAELTRWMAYYLIDPWGDQRADLRAALIAASFHNFNPFRGRGSAPLNPSALLLFPPEGVRREQLTEPEDIEAYFQTLAVAFGG